MELLKWACPLSAIIGLLGGGELYSTRHASSKVCQKEAKELVKEKEEERKYPGQALTMVAFTLL